MSGVCDGDKMNFGSIKVIGNSEWIKGRMLCEETGHLKKA